MASASISRKNVGRIAERIVANELEARGFRAMDLNKEGLAANADLFAARDGRSLLFQVKGSAQGKTKKGWEPWWVNYGYCDDHIMAKKQPMFNRCASYFNAGFVVLVAVRTPSEYRCVVLPAKVAEQVAQLNLEREFRTEKLKGGAHKPGKVWVYLDWVPKARDPGRYPDRIPLFNQEQEILKRYTDNWDI